jgi:hypothetical protein
VRGEAACPLPPACPVLAAGTLISMMSKVWITSLT